MFVDESGFYLLPAVARTYAPVGQTPVLREHLSRDHLSAISAITLEGKLYMHEQDGSLKGPDVGLGSSDTFCGESRASFW